MRVNIDSATFRTLAGTDLPDGSEVQRHDANTISAVMKNNSYTSYQIGNPSITIGTAAVPEPSAFGFGALALAVTGMGRWTRKRFLAAK